jgi:hypothetical protein
MDSAEAPAVGAVCYQSADRKQTEVRSTSKKHPYMLAVLDMSEILTAA